MTTFYCDFENGDDANDGTTFANRWKTLTSGATAARIAPGDEIRIMGSPAPTSLGINGTWTSEALQGTRTVTGATNATPIEVTTSTAHGYSTGDTLTIQNVGGNTATNGTWEITVTGDRTFTLDGSIGNGTISGNGVSRLRNNTVVRLASALTQNIASTGPNRAAWTASADVTATLYTTDFKEHYQADSIAIAAGFTTGLAAYWPTGTLDLSGYQQVSFWIRQNSGTVGADGAVELRLCSDTAGTTVVDTISIPALSGLNRWRPVTVDLGTNLGSSIQSIALYVSTDNGAQTFLLSNIIACKASSDPDSLTLTSLIGKNVEGETWWGIQSINGTRVMLDNETNAEPITTTLRGYYGTSETVTTWKRETIKLGPAASSSTALQATQKAGTDGSPITYSGGWDRTAMTTQNLETWLDGMNGNGYGINIGHNFVNIDMLAFTRLKRGLSNSAGSFCSFSLAAANNNGNALVISLPINTITLGHAAANSSSINIEAGPCTFVLNHGIISGGSAGIYGNGANDFKMLQGSGNGIIANNHTSALSITSNASGLFAGLEFTANGTSSIGSTYIKLALYKCLVSDNTEVSSPEIGPGTVFSQNHDQTADNHKIFLSYALISSATDQRKTASGISWKIQPTNTLRSASWPVPLSLAKVACAANAAVTIKAWMRRSNTGLTMRLVCKGGQIAGVASDVVSSMTADADTWEELTITFTPTEVGVVEITAEAWGGTTYSGWVDDMTISQI